MDTIFKLINNTFEKDFFLGFGYSKKTEATIQKQIEAFSQKFPQAIPELLSNLRKNLPQAYIENITQFFNWDRCIRFLVQFSEEERFICQLSIYGYFSVYQSPCWFKDGRYTYGEKRFLNQKENEVCDLLYDCANILTEPPIWLDSSTLYLTVFDFSIPKINHTYIINIGDVLFTNHLI